MQDDFPWSLQQCYGYLESQLGLVQSNVEAIVAQEIGMLRQQVIAEKISMVEQCSKLVEDVKNARGASGTIDEALLKKEIEKRVTDGLALMEDILDKKMVALEAKLSVDLHHGLAQLSGQMGQWQAQMARAHEAFEQRATAEQARHAQEALMRHISLQDLVKKFMKSSKEKMEHLAAQVVPPSHPEPSRTFAFPHLNFPCMSSGSGVATFGTYPPPPPPPPAQAVVGGRRWSRGGMCPMSIPTLMKVSKKSKNCFLRG